MQRTTIIIHTTILTLAATATAFADPRPFCSVTAADGTKVEVRIDAPLPGLSLDAPPCAQDIDVEGVASTIDIPPQLDLFFMIDRSGSTRDGVLRDEVEAARTVVRSVSPAHVRVSIISFADDARLDVQLTSNFPLVEVTLDDILRDGSDGGTEFVPPLHMLAEEVLRQADPTRTPISLFMSDGANNGSLASVVAEATQLAADGVRVDTFGVGPGADPIQLREIARITGGDYYPILVPADILVILPQVIAVGIDHIEITNLTTGQSLSILPNLDGTFSEPLPIELGFNDIEVIAVADNPDMTRVTCYTDVTVTCSKPPTFSGLPGDETLHCPAAPAPVELSATDVCDRDVPVDFTETTTPGRCLDEYTVDRLWTATDDCGNTVEHNQQVAVVDVTPPAISGIPADATAECDAVPPPASPAASDGCDPAPGISMTETRVDGRCADAYQLQRRWTSADRCGNAAVAGHVVDVDDTTAPELAAQLLPAAPLPPASAGSARSVCSPPEAREFLVECDTADTCDPNPVLAPTVVVSGYDVPAKGVCEPTIETLPVACGERIEIRLLPPACPAKPRKPASVTSTRSDGVRVFIGESVVLSVQSTDRCGNATTVTHDPATTPSPLCDDVLEDGTCCPAIGQPAGKCKVDVCGVSLFGRRPGPPGLNSGSPEN